jgi:flagellar hook-associated protein 1 FlgK
MATGFPSTSIRRRSPTGVTRWLSANSRYRTRCLESKASFQEAYAQLVSEAGSKTRQLQVTSDAQQAILAQAQASRESLSGVNLDEEAANLIRYQQAYQAAAKAMQIGASLFDTILQIAAG